MMSLFSSRTKRPASLSPTTRRVAWIISAVFFIEQLDVTILAPALPSMAQELGTDAISLSATITAYLLGLTVLIPMSGRLAERFGDKALFLTAILGFLLSSVACGFAPNAETLIGLRFVQGLSGALMAPVGRLIVLRSAARHEIVEAMALVILLAMVAPMVGPFIGGLLTSYLGWRWIFWANIPLSLAALYLVWRHLPSTPGNRETAFDITGAVLTGLGFAGLVYGLSALGDAHASGEPQFGQAGIACAIGLILLAAYAAHARRSSAPVLDLALLRLRSFRDAMLSGSLFRVAVGGIPFLLPLTLQEDYGYTPVEAGLIVLVPAIGGFSMKFFTTRLLQKLGYRQGLWLHGIMAALCLALAGALDPRTALIAYVLALFGFGWSRSLQMNAYGTLAYADVEKPRLPAATSFFLSIQHLTTAIGVALAAVLLRAFTQAPGSAALQNHLWTYLLLALLALASALMCFSMPASAGRDLLAAKAKS